MTTRLSKFLAPATMTAALLFAAEASRGDTVVTVDGRTFVGDVKRTDTGYVIILPDGKPIVLRADEVKSLSPGKSPASAPSTQAAPGAQAAVPNIDKLNSLRRSVESMNDLAGIVARYQKFIEQYKGTPVAALAKSDLATWTDRQQRGLTKVGTKWLSEADREKLFLAQFDQVDKARQLLKQGRAKEAEPLIQQVITDDPQNVSALYLLGYIQFNQDKTGPAKKSFEAVNQLAPNHGPTLNNLGVILWRQNQAVASLNWYEQAMAAVPQSKEILNNVAEALHATSEEQKKTAIGLRAVRRFTEQDAKLAESLRPLGWFRYGATFVDQKTIDESKAAEKELKTKLDAVQADFDKARAEIGKIEREIVSNNQDMQRIQASCITTDQQGRTIILPYPGVYYELKAQNRKLTADREVLIKKLDEYRASAKTIQDSAPNPPYTGVHRLIGVEGTPLLLPSPAATSRPSAN